MIENEQRAGLTPLELALFVQKRLALGDKQAVIATRLGKSRQYVTLATALIEAPSWLLDAYRQRRCKGLTELYELRRLHGEYATRVEAWATDCQAITRERLAALRDELAGEATGSVRAAVPRAPGAMDASTQPASCDVEAPRPRAKGHRQINRNVHVEMDGQDYELVVSVAPALAGHLYVRPLNGGPRRVAPASALKLIGFVGR